MGREPLSCFVDCCFVLVQRGHRGACREQGFTVAAATERAIENLPATSEDFQYFLDHDRSVVRCVPPPGHGIGGRHLQNRFTSLSTAGVNCGIAVNSWAASFGYFCPPAGKFIDARLKASRAV